jgi:hypothetical protein
MRILLVCLVLAGIVGLAWWDADTTERAKDLPPHPEAVRVLKEAATQPAGEFQPSRPVEW